jgi:hypothetical protein
VAFFGKQPASRAIKYQVLAYGGGGSSVPSTNFASETWQIRVVSEVQGWLVIGDGTGSFVHRSIGLDENQRQRHGGIFCRVAVADVRF